MRRLVPASIALASTVLTLGAAELALRILSPDRYSVWPPGLSREFASLPDVTPGISGVTRFTINDDGIRGPSFSQEDDYRILALGGSTTECVLLDDEETWPRLLGRELENAFPGSRVWVGNVGRSGHSARDHTLQAEKLPPQYPRIDAALVMAGVNDFMSRLRRGEDWVPLAGASAEYLQDLAWHAFAEAPEFQSSFPFYKRTELWQLARRAWRGLEAADEGPDQGEGARYLVGQRLRRVRAARVGELPELGAALEDYRRTLNRIVTSLDRQGIDPILITQPYLWREDLPPDLERLLWFGKAGVTPDSTREIYYDAGTLAVGLDRFNAVLLDVCRERGIDCVDLASRLPRDTTVFYDDVHFNESGARRVARLLAARFERDPEVRSRLGAAATLEGASDRGAGRRP